ncbi:MAG: Serine/threonine-protein kinase PK-1 [Syntrophorhabdaceae bacterium PtaU1.Bin034]|jgi:serine/threonine-protein kinase|nr:MAG: Serine/threonine-protein kinase PK-1 [Syntrophorhabdaceae bacterium PtaU1.Bin034]
MKWLRILLYALTCIVVFICTTSLSIRFILKDDSTVLCPDVTGLDVEEAKTTVQQKGLSLLIVKYEKKRDIPYNRVLVQKPDAAIPVKVGRTVSVILSDGPRPSTIPFFVGLPIEEGQKALEEAGIALKKIIYVPSDVPGQILAQAPGSGENILDEEGMVFVVGGRERRFYVMPEITGSNCAASIQEMDRKRIHYSITPIYNQDGTGNITVKSSILPMTIFNEGQVLELQTISGG